MRLPDTPRLLHGLAVAFPGLLIGALILRFARNVPTWDDWEMARIFINMRDGATTLDEFTAQHNEHRMFFPLLLKAGLAQLTDWNLVVECLVNLALAGLILALVLRMARPLLAPLATGPRSLWTLLFSATLFGLAQRENWLWGWQIQWYLSVLAVVGAIACLARGRDADRPWFWLGGAMALGVVAQFSLASGIALWPVALVLFWHYPAGRRGPAALSWLAAGALSTGLFLCGFVRPLHHPSPLIALSQPAELIRYFFLYLTGPLPKLWVLGAALLAGSAWMAWRLWRADGRRAAPWIALGLYAVASAAITALGRAGFGYAQAGSSRYVTVAMLLALAAIALALQLHRDRSVRVRRAVVAGIVLLALGSAAQAVHVWPTYRGHSETIVKVRRDCLMRYEFAEAGCLTELYPAAIGVRSLMAGLDRVGWVGMGPRTDAWRDLPTMLVYEGDKATQSPVVAPDPDAGWLAGVERQGDSVVLHGWARWPDLQGATRGQVLVVAGARVVGRADIDRDSSDLQARYPDDPSAVRAGWRLVVPAAALPPAGIRAFLPIAGRLHELNGSPQLLPD